MNNLQTITANDYLIYIGDIFTSLKNQIHRMQPSKVVVLLDEHTERFCFPILTKNINDIAFESITIKSGEVHKTLNTCEWIWNEFIRKQVDRHSLVINLSGGVLLDMGGFVASTFKRGLKFMNMPTTLLSMVDASVGGKTGINYKGYKNFIGLFSTPHAVFIYPDFLHTLPERELQTGKVEMIKHGLIADEKHLWDSLQLLTVNYRKESYQSLIATSIGIKNTVVLQDAKEKNLRKILNFGHTVGHAFESFFLSGDASLLHGEAVVHGIVISLLLSVDKLGFSQQMAKKIINTLFVHFPKITFTDEDILWLIHQMKQDKKNMRQAILFVLLKDIGEPQFDVEVTEEEIVAVLKKYQDL